MIEKRIYNGYAFSENELDKKEINYRIYQELTQKYKILYKDQYDQYKQYTSEELATYDLIFIRSACYLHSVYKVLKKPENITDEELLLIFDQGNLCFGGRKISKDVYEVSED